MRHSISADFLVHSMLEDCFYSGVESNPRGHGTREVINWSGVLTNPRARIVKNPVRDMRLGYAAAHVAWNLGERNDVSILYWNPNGKRISDDGKTFHGANYGVRMMPYLNEAIELLYRDPSTRRAWVPIWHPKDIVNDFVVWGAGEENLSYDKVYYSRKGKDVPCTLGFALRLTAGSNGPNSKLDFQVVMRSQSVGVVPYDLFLFTVIQELVANTLGVELGKMYWACNSLHLYDREANQRKAELDWYDARRYKQHAQIDAQHMQFMQRAMDPIDKTLQEAIDEWPGTYDVITKGIIATTTDQIEDLMLSGRPRDEV